MSDNITKRVGLGTAYGFAKAGGYEGTVAEFTELLGNIAIDLARIENLSVTVTTLPAGSQATASLNGSVLSLGIPKGDKGDKGNTGETGAPAGFGTVSATVDDTIGTPSVEVTASGADTAKNFAFAFHNLKGQKGDKGDTGEVSEAELTQALEDFAENGTVANAEQLTTDIRANDQTPYLFRTAGGSVDIGDREYINGIVGGTVAWNQLLQNIALTTETINGVTFTVNADRTITINGTATAFARFDIGTRIDYFKNHVYAVIGVPQGGSSSTYRAVIMDYNYNDAIKKFNIDDYYTPRLEVAQGATVNNLKCSPMLYDLTLMFGSTIADYIYSLEQANAGAGVAFFKTLFPKPYYAYNAGELMSVKGLVSHDMTGFNQWDEEWENGRYDFTTGATSGGNGLRSKNKTKVLPNTAYHIVFGDYGTSNIVVLYYDADENYISYENKYSATRNVNITTPSDAYYMCFNVQTSSAVTTYNHDICINLSWDGSEDGNYEPYQKWSYPLDSDLELRGIPKLDASNNLYYDGDTYESDGTVTRKYGVVDMGTLNWGSDPNRQGVFYTGVSGILTGDLGGKCLCSGYEVKYISVNTSYDKYISNSPSYGAGVFVRDTAYTSASDFKTAMSGVYLVYELATPTTETADPYTNPQIVNDFGTEEFVISNTVDVPIPVGNNTDYPINLKAKVEMAPNSPDGDGDYIVRQTNGTNEYVAFANNATIQNILARLEALEG